MKTLMLVMTALLLAVGCIDTSNFPPITAKMSRETESSLEGIPKLPDKVAIFIDKETREKVMIQAPDGTIGRTQFDSNGEFIRSKYQIKFGESFTNTLVEVCQATFFHVRLLDGPFLPTGYSLIILRAENVDVGFEFAASQPRRPVLDQARISLLLRTTIIGKDGKEIANYKETFNEDQREKFGSTNQMAAYENCLNKVVVKYVERLSKILARRSAHTRLSEQPSK